MTANKSAVAGTAVVPTWISQVVLGRPLEDVQVPEHADHPFEQVRLLVRLDRRPLGYVPFAAESGSVLTAQQIATGVWERLEAPIAKVLREHGLEVPASLPLDGLKVPDRPALVDPPLITVIICTRNRPEGAATALSDVAQLHYPNYEVVLVDNASSDDATEKIVAERFGEDERIRYVREPRPGLSYARNKGLSEARGSIVAYTDDDVHVDPWWLDGIAEGFRRGKDIGCVTGLVPSAELDNAVQHYFDQRATSWGSNLQPRVFDLKHNRPNAVLYPYSAGIFGTGANFAFDAKTIRDAGGFDEALGAGTPSQGGEDLDAFIKVLRSGKKIVNEPSAVIWHVHRSELEQLNRQMFYYGAGLSAFIAKYLLRPSTGFQVLRRIIPGLIKMRSIGADAGGGQILPRSIWGIELMGMAFGPIGYLKGVLRCRKIARRGTSGSN